MRVMCDVIVVVGRPGERVKKKGERTAEGEKERGHVGRHVFFSTVLRARLFSRDMPDIQTLAAIPHRYSAQAVGLPQSYQRTDKYEIYYIDYLQRTLDNRLLNTPILRTTAYCTNFSEPFG